jgi:hypothetical protein
MQAFCFYDFFVIIYYTKLLSKKFDPHKEHKEHIGLMCSLGDPCA